MNGRPVDLYSKCTTLIQRTKLFNSIQLNMFTIQIVSRCFSETQSMTPAQILTKVILLNLD